MDLIKYINTFSQLYKYYIVVEILADHLKKPGHPLVELAEGQLNRLDRIYQESLTHTCTVHDETVQILKK